jgi:hypothetical protein
MLFVKTTLKKMLISFILFLEPQLLMIPYMNICNMPNIQKLNDYAPHNHTQIKQYSNLDINLYIPSWISFKTNALMRYFCNITAQMIPPKMKIMVSVVDNIQISLVFFL